MVIAYAMMLIMSVMAVIIWFVGRDHRASLRRAHGPLNIGLSYYSRAARILRLLTEDWPRRDAGRGISRTSVAPAIRASPTAGRPPHRPFGE